MSKKNRTNQLPARRTGSPVLLQQQQHFSGPLPLPAHLEKYNEILPGAAERIMAMAEAQSKHRREMETKSIDSDISRSKLGLWFGFIIGTLGLSLGAFLMYAGKLLEGGLLGGGTLASLVWVFIYGSRQRRLERESRSQHESTK